MNYPKPKTIEDLSLIAQHAHLNQELIKVESIAEKEGNTGFNLNDFLEFSYKMGFEFDLISSYNAYKQVKFI